MGYFDEGVMCNIETLDYDFTSKVGRLVVAPDNICDVRGTIALFKRIDKRVLQIQVYVMRPNEREAELDILYSVIEGKWEERLPLAKDA